jgi:hypothetical protein
MGEPSANWELKIDADTSRKALSDAIKNAADRMIQPAGHLTKLRSEYTWMPDLTAALVEDSHVGPLMQAAKAFANAVTLSGQEDAAARVVRLRPLEGALSAEMEQMHEWSFKLVQVANLRIKDLSGAH